jgi:hypothetical protein
MPDEKLYPPLASLAVHDTLDPAIDRLERLVPDDYDRLRLQWQHWHFQTAFTVRQLVGWVALATVAAILLIRPDAARAWLATIRIELPAVALRIAGGLLALFATTMLAPAIGGISADQSWAAYLTGYRAGLRAGVQRAFDIPVDDADPVAPITNAERRISNR